MERSKAGEREQAGSWIPAPLSGVWHFLWHEDSVLSWLASLSVMFLLIKFVFYPLLGLVFGTQFPVVAVVSNSMEHPGGFDEWWAAHEDFYLQRGITREEFQSYPFANGFNKGDIMILVGTKPERIARGDILVFWSGKPYPIIHRIVSIDLDAATEERVYQTKGDFNRNQVQKPPILDETNIAQDQVIGRAVARIPYLGYMKIWFVGLQNYIKRRFFGLQEAPI